MKFLKILLVNIIRENEPMGESIALSRCGGNADLYVMPGSIEELSSVVKACRENDYPFMVIGNGSNILVKDQGYKGAIIEVK